MLCFPRATSNARCFKPSPPTKLARRSERLAKVRSLWEGVRTRFVEDTDSKREFQGLPAGVKPRSGSAESAIEQDFVRPVLHILGFSTENNRTLRFATTGTDGETSLSLRPNVITFGDAASHHVAVHAKAEDARIFCRDAHYILDAKKFAKSLGSDEENPLPGKADSASVDVDQVHGYLSGARKTWGVLTNGRCWRLMRAGRRFAHLRFDLVRFLESLRGETPPTEQAALGTFAQFFLLFGPPAVGGGYLDELLRESEAETRRVRDILRERAHEAVERLARGFCEHEGNEYPAVPDQAQLDELREHALIFLYRLLFVLKAEAQNLLPMESDVGAETPYARSASTASIFRDVKGISAHERTQVSAGYSKLVRLFELVDRGGDYGVPPYNGGLFDREKHPRLSDLRLRDDVVYEVLRALIYLSDDERDPVPYAELDVRDFGDIYEGLLGQRFVSVRKHGVTLLQLRSQNGDQKASGSYFTPDVLVEQVVRDTLAPLLAPARTPTAEAVLTLRIVDPAMGSGHFLVKVVDVIAWDLTLRFDPADPEAPRDNGPLEFAYWKRRVVESCIYGVDVNPMAVELAKVALWLHSAAKGKPLSFLDHHLKCGNALIGAPVAGIQSPYLLAKPTRNGATWIPRPVAKPAETPTVAETAAGKTAKKAAKKKGAALEGQLAFALPLDPVVVSGVLAQMKLLLARPSDKAADVKQKAIAYEKEVEARLAAHRLLGDLWCLQGFLDPADPSLVSEYLDPDHGTYARLRTSCAQTSDVLRSQGVELLSDTPLVKRARAARGEGYGLAGGGQGMRLLRFFHWELEFPDVFFDDDGKLRSGGGFDGLVGNPPWDKLKPAKRDYYGAFSEDVANTQGPSLDKLITALEAANPALRAGFEEYQARIEAYLDFLANAGMYEHQTAVVEGKKTGGDPDLFRFFVERAVKSVRAGGQLGLVVPSTLWAGDGCTALRRLLFEETSVTRVLTFENYRKWAFDIDTRFKFTTLIAERTLPSATHTFPAAFMLRSGDSLDSLESRLVTLSADRIAAISPSNSALIDLKSAREAELVARLHRDFPRLGAPASGWGVKYARELDMTNDAWLFKHRAWMTERGFTQVLPVRGADGTWTKIQNGPGPVAGLPASLPPGGEYWVAASAEYYRKRGYTEREGYFYAPADKGLRDADRIVVGGIYTALYEGRMVHNFDPAQKRYLAGEGRKALWEIEPMEAKVLVPRVFVCPVDGGIEPGVRIGFCDVTGATNERTMLAAMISPASAAGNKVPTLKAPLVGRLQPILSSFVWDFLIRMRVSTTLNWLYVRAIPTPPSDCVPSLLDLPTLKLNSLVPELAPLSKAVSASAWTYATAERDSAKRATLRAEIDAIVADLYGLSVPEYAYVLTAFPLLDRDQPALPGDRFVTDGDERSKRRGERGEAWDEVEGAIVECLPRSFVTRDLALLTYMQRKKYPIPQDLNAFYRDVVGHDPEGPLSRFRIGEVRDLEARVLRAREMGAVAYIPSGSGEDEDS